MRRVVAILMLLLAAAAVVGALNVRRNAALLGVDWRILKRVPAKEVQFQRPQRAPIVQIVTGPGKIELIDEAKIASETIGQVEAVYVDKGDLVQKGDLLVTLDDEDAKARLESAEARIERLRAAIQLAEADLRKAQEEWQGFEHLKERGFSSETELRDVSTLLEKTKATLAMSQHELTESFAIRRNSQQDLERTQIRAPIAGTVIFRDVEVGEVVIAGTTNLPGTVLLTIGDMNKMRVRADIDESDVALVRPGQPARIYLQANQDEQEEGMVELISPKGTKVGEVVSFETLIRVTGNRDALLPEMTATVEIEVQRVDDALGVPVQAVVHRRLKSLPDTPLFRDWIARQPKTPAEKGKDDAARYVTVVFIVQDGVAHARPVQTGISDQERIEVLAGISPDDEVVVGPFRALDEMTDGQPVKPDAAKPAPEDAAGAAAVKESA